MSISEEMSNSEGISNSEAKIINVEYQIIHSCTLNKTGGKCDWNPNIGKFIQYERSRLPSHSFGQVRFQSCRFIINFLNWKNFLP